MQTDFRVILHNGLCRSLLLTKQSYANVQAEAFRKVARVLGRIKLEGKAGEDILFSQRLFEGVVGKPVGVRVPPSAHRWAGTLLSRIPE